MAGYRYPSVGVPVLQLAGLDRQLVPPEHEGGYRCGERYRENEAYRANEGVHDLGGDHLEVEGAEPVHITDREQHQQGQSTARISENKCVDQGTDVVEDLAHAPPEEIRNT